MIKSSFSNKVAILGFYGGDKTHCLSAWQSTAFDSNKVYEGQSDINLLFENTAKSKRNTPESLLRFLAENGHHTPFEKSLIHFQVRADVATHIQFLKHRIGVSINSESARYKELTDKYYLPADWDGLDNVTIEVSGKQTNLLELLDSYAKLGHFLYHRACEKLTPVIGRQRAKETARFFLPYCKQLDFDVVFNFRSFMHFQSLRNSTHAQKEIRDIAHKMLVYVANIDNHPFDLSLRAFGIDVDSLML